MVGLIYMGEGEGGSPVPHPAQCMMKHPTKSGLTINFLSRSTVPREIFRWVNEKLCISGRSSGHCSLSVQKEANR